MISKFMLAALWVLLINTLALQGQEPTIEPAGSFGGYLSTAVLKDTYAYVGQGAHIRVLDVSDPRNPRRVGSLQADLIVNDLCISGNLLYGVGDSQFIIVDLVSPASPVLKSVKVVRSAQKVSVSGTHAYIGCGYDGLKILDVANPAAPAEVKDMAGIVVDLWVENNRAYVQEDSSFPNPAVLKVYDISSPASPVLLGSFPEGGANLGVRDILLDGNWVYQAGFNGVRILDVSVPASPQEKGRYAATDLWWPRIALNGNHLYLLTSAWDRDPFIILDISDPAHPVQAATKNIGDLRMIVTAPPTGYFLAMGSFDIYNIATPTSPSKEGSWQTLEFTHQAVVHGSHLFVNEGPAVGVYGLQNPAEPVQLNAYRSANMINQIFLADNRLYERISTWNEQTQNIEEKVAIYNAADPANIDPANPPFLGTYTSQGRISDFYAKDNRLVLLAYTLDPETWTVASQWLEVVDLAPAGSSLQATKLADYALPGQGVAVCLSGTIAYAAYQNDPESDAPMGVEVISLANPSAPQKLNSIVAPREPWSAWAPSCVHVSGQTLWIVDVPIRTDLAPRGLQCG